MPRLQFKPFWLPACLLAFAVSSIALLHADDAANKQKPPDKQKTATVATSKSVVKTPESSGSANSGSTSAASSATLADSSAKPSKSWTADSKTDPKPDSKFTTKTTARNPRVLFIVAKNSPICDQELVRLKKKHGDFDAMRANGWKIGTGPENHLQIVDRDDVPDIVEKLQLKEFPTVVGIENEEVGRYFRYGCTTPLDAWTFGFLLKGVDQRPSGMVKEAARVASTGHYPLRGNHWSVEGDWNPTREKTLEHLHGPNHQSQLLSSWHIEEWSLEELRSAHDDLHEKYDIGGGSSRSSSSGNSGSSYLKFKGGT